MVWGRIHFGGPLRGSRSRKAGRGGHLSCFNTFAALFVNLQISRSKLFDRVGTHEENLKMSSCVETYTVEPAPEQLKGRRPRRYVRRRRYDRVLLLDSSNSSSGFAVRMPRKLKVANLAFRPVRRRMSIVPLEEDAPAPSWVWKLLGESFVAGMADDTPSSSRDLSLVPVKPPRSLPDEIVPEPEISFTLGVLEESYEDHLRSAFGGRYA
ncbi:hypothetical protein R1sor_023851 [Riccia sorocarpa]|uniref:Uncharacterized protein n=1 Tax=Riccia sorocarpa TaxID=122646 RepID=A0ABD3GNU5_9MARC